LEDLLSWLYILAFGFLILGLVQGISRLKSMRSKTHPQAEIEWKQLPLSPWRYETLSMVVITIHVLGLLSLAAFLLFTVARSEMFLLLMQAIWGWALFISIFGVIFTSHAVGVTVTYHLAQRWIKPVSYGISKDGLWYSGSLIGWGSYSQYEIGPEDGLISLYSSYSPPLRTWVIQPPPESFPGVLGIIQQNLPPIQPVLETPPWQRSPAILIFGMTFLVLGALLLAIPVWLYDQTWVWIYCFVAFFLLLVLGNKLLSVFSGQTKQLPQKEPEI